MKKMKTVPNQSQQAHTPGKLEIEHPCGFPYTGTYLVSHQANDKKHFHHFIAEVRQLRERGESLANAKRLRAAWNAFDGVSTEEIPGLVNQNAMLTERLQRAREVNVGQREDANLREDILRTNNARFREALHTIGYKPIGDSMAGAGQVLNDIVSIARTALAEEEK